MNKHIIAILLLFTIFYSCETEQFSDQNLEPEKTAEYLPGPPPPMKYSDEAYIVPSETKEPDYVPKEKTTTFKKAKRKNKIIKQGYIQALVTDIQKGKEVIDQILTTIKSHYEHESYSDSDYESVYSLTIRIPAEFFNSFVNSFGNSDAKIVSK